MHELFIERGSLPFYVKVFFDFELKIHGSRVRNGKMNLQNISLESSEYKFLLTRNPLNGWGYENYGRNTNVRRRISNFLVSHFSDDDENIPSLIRITIFELQKMKRFSHEWVV